MRHVLPLGVFLLSACTASPGDAPSDDSDAPSDDSHTDDATVADADGDGIPDATDACPGEDDTLDADTDGQPDTCDPCPVDAGDDGDGDGVCDGEDACPVDNPDDSDGDGVCDADDLCAGAPEGACDLDGDGFTPNDGDCCDTLADCAAPERVNPDALEQTAASGPAVDDDCDGETDEVDAACDGTLTLTDTNPLHGAAALGLCDERFLLDANWVTADGDALTPGANVGLKASWGTSVDPTEGERVLVLSTGRARAPEDVNACGHKSCANHAGEPPAGFPAPVTGCSVAGEIADDVALEVRLQVPSNVSTFAFDYAFYSFEYPEWVCDTFNDQFIALMSPAPAGAVNGNIAVDAQLDPVSVNTPGLVVCTGCAAGTDALAGTGFDVWNDAGATLWTSVEAPVVAGSTIVVRFAIYDVGDANFDSTVLLDNVRWLP